MWLGACFAVSCYFYGVGFNLLFSAVALLGPAGVLIATSPRTLAATLAANPGVFWACVVSVAGIVLQHLLFSISPDSSFAPSIILSAVPLWACAILIVPRPALVFQGIFWLIAVFATVSAAEFVLAGIRAHAPLWDPNNYVTLLYLAWIPWVLQRLAQPAVAVRGISIGLVTWLFAVALLATHSRFALLVLLGVVLLSGVYCAYFRLPFRSWLWLLAGVSLATACYVLLDPPGATGGAVSAVPSADSAAESERLMMIDSALQAVVERGGVWGTGLYTFSLLYPLYRNVAEQGTTGEFVHSDFLQLTLEGGVLLLLPLLLLCAGMALMLWQRALSHRVFVPALAFATAVGVAMAHALVNFVLYVLPLTIMLGVLIGCAFVRGADLGRTAFATPWVRAGKWLAVAMLALNLGYLALDALTYGVFSRQLHVPGAAWIRGDAQRMLEFARLAQQLNGRRGVPILAEARILQAMAGTDAHRLQLAQIEAAYQRAIEVDPWNPSARVAYASFLQGQPNVQSVEPRVLLEQALELNPADPVSNLALLETYRREADAEGLVRVISNTLTWCELMRRRESDVTEGLLDQIELIAGRLQAQDLVEQIQTCRARNVSATGAARNPTWMMRWLRDGSQ